MPLPKKILKMQYLKDPEVWDEDDRDHDEFKNWEAGESILRQEERTANVRAVKEAERKGKTGHVRAWKKALAHEQN